MDNATDTITTERFHAWSTLRQEVRDLRDDIDAGLIDFAGLEMS